MEVLLLFQWNVVEWIIEGKVSVGVYKQREKLLTTHTLFLQTDKVQQTRNKMAQAMLMAQKNFPLSDIWSVEWSNQYNSLVFIHQPINPQYERSMVLFSKPNWHALQDVFPQVKKFLEGGDPRIKELGPFRYYPTSKYFKVTRGQGVQLLTISQIRETILRQHTVTLSLEEWEALENLYTDITQDTWAPNTYNKPRDASLLLYMWHMEGGQVPFSYTNNLKFYSQQDAQEHYSQSFPFLSPGEMKISQSKHKVPHVEDMLKKALLVGLVELIKKDLGQESLTIAEISSNYQACLQNFANSKVLYFILEKAWGQMEFVPPVPFPVEKPAELVDMLEKMKQGAPLISDLEQISTFGSYMCDVRFLKALFHKYFNDINNLLEDY